MISESIDDINVNVKIIEKFNSINQSQFIKLLQLLGELRKLDTASGFNKMIDICNNELDDFKKLSKIISLAKYKKSDSSFTFYLHKNIRERSKLVESVYRILSTFDWNNPNQSLTTINEELEKLISKSHTKTLSLMNKK
jgi:hypothetical protein